MAKIQCMQIARGDGSAIKGEETGMFGVAIACVREGLKTVAADQLFEVDVSTKDVPSMSGSIKGNLGDMWSIAQDKLVEIPQIVNYSSFDALQEQMRLLERFEGQLTKQLTAVVPGFKPVKNHEMPPVVNLKKPVKPNGPVKKA